MTFEDDLLALERQTLEKAAGGLLTQIAELRRLLAADDPRAVSLLASLLTAPMPKAEVPIRQGIIRAWARAARRASDAVEQAGGDPIEVPLQPSHFHDPIRGLDTLLVDAQKRAAALRGSGAAPDVAATPLFEAATTLRARTVTQINASANGAALEVGQQARRPMVWEAERDACVFCLGLAGEVVAAGDTFPTPDLYAPAPKHLTAAERPPLHPHCRCQLAVLVDPSYADALKREAQRSILRGHSLQSESQAVRLQAAERLLARNPVAPKTVKAFAAAAVKRGAFPTRAVPAGDPRLVITRMGPPPASAATAPPPRPSAPPPPARTPPPVRPRPRIDVEPRTMTTASVGLEHNATPSPGMEAVLSRLRRAVRKGTIPTTGDSVEVRPGATRTAQSHIEGSKVLGIIEAGATLDNPVGFLEADGTPHLYDGHHRTVALWARGRRARMDIADLDRLFTQEALEDLEPHELESLHDIASTNRAAGLLARIRPLLAG